MINAELIAKLQALPLDATVVIPDGDGEPDDIDVVELKEMHVKKSRFYEGNVYGTTPHKSGTSTPVQVIALR